MDLRLALYELAAQHQLDATATKRLQVLAGLKNEPVRLAYWLPRGVAVLAAALGGLGIIFWIAANWDTLGRFGRFALLEFIFLVLCVGALMRPAARSPLGLLALLSIGGLFAYFGQTYQTGADPWQLFAVWAVLALPLCLSIRSDVLWTPWALVVVTGISLWVHAHASHSWQVAPQDVNVFITGWGATVLLIFALSPVLRHLSGTGPWAFRTSVTLGTMMITTTALATLFQYDALVLYFLGLVVLGAAAVGLATEKLFEIYGLSALALGLNVLLISGLVRLLFHRHSGIDWLAALFIIGLAAAGLLAGTVSVLLRLSRNQAAKGARA